MKKHTPNEIEEIYLDLISPQVFREKFETDGKKLSDFILPKVFYFLLGVFITLFFMRGCKSEQIPSLVKKDTFKTEKPIEHKPIKGKTEYIKGKEVIRYKNNEINKELAEENYNLQIAYINTKDSLEKQKLYKTAIELKSFNQPFENDNFKANVSGVVQGEVKSMQLDYELKKIPIEKVRFRMLLGGGVTFNSADLNLGLQNAKGNIFEIGYDTKKNIRIGYKQSLFSIKK